MLRVEQQRSSPTAARGAANVVKVVGLLSLLVGGLVSRWKFPLQPHWTKGHEDVWEATKWNIKEPPTLQPFFFFFIQFLSLFIARAEWKDIECSGFTGLDKHCWKWDCAVLNRSWLNPSSSILTMCLKCSCLLKQSPADWFLQGSYKLKHWTEHFNIYISWK